MKKTVIIYFSFLIVTVLLFPCLKIEYEVIEDVDLSTSSFFEIFLNNAFVVISIYITSLFTKTYAYFVYALNGVIIGVAISLLIMNNCFADIMLLLPHGVIEIPSVLMTGSIMDKPKEYWLNNKKKYIMRMLINIGLIALSALIEKYLTPILYYLALGMME